ncbi:PASTA domain-containing protein [bacterium]|nr:PASTA domain-containing protein [bacterium]
MIEGGFELFQKLSEDSLTSTYEIKKEGKKYYLIVFKPPLEEKTKEALLEIGEKLKRITQPNLLALIDIHQEDDKIFLIYEEARGMSLKERFKLLAPFNPSVAVDTAIAIGEALSALHKSGLAHGDLHPGNVVVTPEAHVKVLNAGIFIPFQEQIKKGDFASLMLRAPYTAPEIAGGSPPSPQTDIYSLGAILFEALTGSPPFEGPDPLAIVVKQNNEPAPSPKKLNPGIPRALEGVVLKALQKDLDKRYSTIDQMLGDLKEIREALRYGYSLNWSPMDEEGRIGRPKIEVERETPFIRSAVLIIWSLIGLALIFLFLYAFLGLGIPQEVVVPDLSRKGLEEARTLLLQNGLKLGDILERENEEIPAGYIISTQPPAGSLVRKGRRIDIIVSTGAPYVVIPDLRSLDEERARKLLSDLGLAVGDVSYVADRYIPFGQVISQSPAPNSRVAKGTAVYLKVSLGPPVEATPPSVSQVPSEGEKKSATVRFVVPDKAESHKITIEVEDAEGIHTVYDNVHKPGDLIDQQVEGVGTEVTIRVYIDENLVKEEVLK